MISEPLFKIHQGILKCSACRLSAGRKIAVPGEGPAKAKIVFVGEAPGAEEDSTGRPFVGRSGIFLDSLLALAGLNRREIFITSAVKCRPPANRTPKNDELAACTGLWLNRQIKIIGPSLVVLLGSTALKAVGRPEKLAAWHGQVIEADGLNLFATYHPSAAMRFPWVRKKIQADFIRLKKLISRLK